MERRGAVAHRSEQAAHNHLVDGSTPSSPTNELMLKELLMKFFFIVETEQHNSVVH